MSSEMSESWLIYSVKKLCIHWFWCLCEQFVSLITEHFFDGVRKENSTFAAIDNPYLFYEENFVLFRFGLWIFIAIIAPTPCLSLLVLPFFFLRFLIHNSCCSLITLATKKQSTCKSYFLEQIIACFTLTPWPSKADKMFNCCINDEDEHWCKAQSVSSQIENNFSFKSCRINMKC